MLTSGRRSGWGPGPIPPSEVLAYLDRFHPELTEDEAMAWLQIIGRVDARQRELAREDAETKRRPTGPEQKVRKR